MKKIEFGIRLPTGGPLASTESVKRIAAEAENLGYSAVWARDNLTWSVEMAKTHISEGSIEAFPDEYLPIVYDPIVSFSEIAGLTGKIKLGFSVLCLPFRNPILLAKQIATLDAISNGRVIFGVGVGAWKKQFDSFGIPFDMRGKIMDETFHALRKIWTTPISSYNGTFVRFQDVEVYPKPVQKPYPCVLVGGHSRASLRRVAEYGDGWIPTTDRSPEEVEKGIDTIRNLSQKFGRETTELQVISEIHACISNTDEEAIQKVSKTLLREETLRTFMISTGADMIERTLVGSASSIIRKIERYKEAGITHFELKPIYMTIEDLSKQMSMFRDRVMSSY